MLKERRNEIAKRLLSEGKISTSKLANEYGVSSETIRKDLIWLEKNGYARKGHGAAVATDQLLEQPFCEKETQHAKEKRAIASLAAELVHDGDVVILDSGSTVLELAKFLALKENITIFTNSLKVATYLTEKKKRVFLFGGEVRLSSNALTGDWALRMMEMIDADIAFLGASGLLGQDGPCVESFEESAVKHAMMKAAGRKILLADASKLTKKERFQFAKWQEFEMLITNPSAEVKDIRNKAPKLMIRTKQ